MKATTKDNLSWRVDCKFGATAGKFDLAKVGRADGQCVTNVGDKTSSFGSHSIRRLAENRIIWEGGT